MATYGHKAYLRMLEEGQVHEAAERDENDRRAPWFWGGLAVKPEPPKAWAMEWWRAVRREIDFQVGLVVKAAPKTPKVVINNRPTPRRQLLAKAWKTNRELKKDNSSLRLELEDLRRCCAQAQGRLESSLARERHPRPFVLDDCAAPGLDAPAFKILSYLLVSPLAPDAEQTIGRTGSSARVLDDLLHRHLIVGQRIVALAGHQYVGLAISPAGVHAWLNKARRVNPKLVDDFLALKDLTWETFKNADSYPRVGHNGV